MREWRNWYTRTLEVRMSQDLEVRVLSRAQLKNSHSGSFLIVREKEVIISLL